jgi:hypothetical protein
MLRRHNDSGIGIIPLRQGQHELGHSNNNNNNNYKNNNNNNNTMHRGRKVFPKQRPTFAIVFKNAYRRRSRWNNLCIVMFIGVLVFRQLSWGSRFWFDVDSSLLLTETTMELPSMRQQLSSSHDNPPTTITTTTTFRGRVYYCGYESPLTEYLFPDYDYMGDAPWELPDQTSTNETVAIPDHTQDLLVVGLWGANCNRKGDERQSFAGKILYINGEPHGDAFSQAWDENAEDKVYQIGPYGAVTKPWNPQLDGFFRNHSLQVYQTALAFMGKIYLPTYHPHNHHHTKTSEAKDSSGDETAPQTTHSEKAALVFDPWKQLIEGNGRSSASGPEPTRIPAVVYVSRNCVEHRQDAAELLAKEFRDLATSGVGVVSIDQEGDAKTKKQSSEVQPPKSRLLRRQLLDSQIGDDREDSGGGWKPKIRDVTASNFQALHQQAAEKKMGENNINDNNSAENAEKARIEQDPSNSNSNSHSNIEDNDYDIPIDQSSSFLHYGGECSVEGGIPVPSHVLDGWENSDRSRFQSNYKTIYTRYKYCLVMENIAQEGYVTEKLIHALLGGCLPIYYGSKTDVDKIFRNDAFVFFDVNNPRLALDEIRRLENDPAEYLRRTDRSLPLLKATPIMNINEGVHEGEGGHNSSNSNLNSTAATVDLYFSLLPNIGTGKLCREIHEMLGLPLPESFLPTA